MPARTTSISVAVVALPDVTGSTLYGIYDLFSAVGRDWPFLMALGTADGYAVMRVKSHLSRFSRLAEQIRDGLIAEEELLHLEQTDSIFSELDYSLYCPASAAKRD